VGQNSSPVTRPYASEDIVSVPIVTAEGNRYQFSIDPGTQRWLILRPETLAVLTLANGRKTVPTIAEAALAMCPEFGSRETIVKLIEELLAHQLLFPDKAQHRVASTPIYNACEPVGVHIEITNACNMTCTHCYVASGSALPNEMTWEEIRTAIDMLPPFSGKQVAISGGEPIVRKGCMEFIEYCAVDCGHHVDLYTNGRKFPRKFAKQIQSINQQQLGKVRVQVSLEGATAPTNDIVRGPGSFDDALASLRMFKEVGLGQDLVVFVCLTKSNIQEVDDLIRLCESLDVGMLVFSQWQRQGNAKDIPWSSIAPSTKQWVDTGLKLLNYSNPRLRVFGNFYGDLRNNEAGRLCLESPMFPKHVYFYNAFPRITPQGDIFADQLWVSKDWILGNIRRGDDLDGCFRKARFFAQLEAMEGRVSNIVECDSCCWRDLCGAGSAGHTFAEHGHMNAKDQFCESRIWWFEKYVRDRAQRALGQTVWPEFQNWSRLGRGSSQGREMGATSELTEPQIA